MKFGKNILLIITMSTIFAAHASSRPDHVPMNTGIMTLSGAPFQVHVDGQPESAESKKQAMIAEILTPKVYTNPLSCSRARAKSKTIARNYGAPW